MTRNRPPESPRVVADHLHPRIRRVQLHILRHLYLPLLFPRVDHRITIASTLYLEVCTLLVFVSHSDHYSEVILPPPGMLTDGQYPGLPTSATRLHQATWPQPHSPWADGPQQPPQHAHMFPISYSPPPPGSAYYPSPYYRTNLVPPPHPELGPHSSQPSNITGSPDAIHSPSSCTGSPADGDPAGTLPVIDPSLDVGTSTSASRAGGETPIPLEVAVNAVLNSVSAEREPSMGSTGAPRGGEESESTARGDLSSPSDASNSNAPYSSPGSTLERPPEMDQILTEDGEPMLNPGSFYSFSFCVWH